MDDWTLDTSEESLMTDAELDAFLASSGCSQGGASCPPPDFSLPPPPPPPWLDTLPGCYGTANCADTPLVTSVHVQDIVQTVAVIIVSSLVIVVCLVLGAAVLYRRWRTARKEREQEQEQEEHQYTMAAKVAGLAPLRTTNLYISEQQLLVEVGRQGELPAPALIIGGVPFHLVQGGEPQPIYESIDSEQYSDLSSLGSSGGREGGSEGQYSGGGQYSELEELGGPLARVQGGRPASSQSYPPLYIHTGGAQLFQHSTLQHYQQTTPQAYQHASLQAYQHASLQAYQPATLQAYQPPAPQSYQDGSGQPYQQWQSWRRGSVVRREDNVTSL